MQPLPYAGIKASTMPKQGKTPFWISSFLSVDNYWWRKVTKKILNLTKYRHYFHLQRLQPCKLMQTAISIKTNRSGHYFDNPNPNRQLQSLASIHVLLLQTGASQWNFSLHLQSIVATPWTRRTPSVQELPMPRLGTGRPTAQTRNRFCKWKTTYRNSFHCLATTWNHISGLVVCCQARCQAALH